MDKKQMQAMEDRIVNRILINFGIGILAYLVLWVLWRATLNNVAVIITAAIFAVCAIICFIMTKFKVVIAMNKSKSFLSYGIMFVAFIIALAIIKSSYIVSWIVGVPRFLELAKNAKFEQMINAQNDLIFVAIAGAVYLGAMLIYNIVLLFKLHKHK